MIKAKERIIEYDLMRILFMLMTLGVHVIAYTIKRDNNYMILDNFFIICNPLFFMLSGRFNLSKKFNKKEDYIEFYKDKFKSIIIPFFIFSLIMQIILNGSLKGFGTNILSNNIEPTYWFIYTLIGILLLSPFYSKMLQNMNKNEKKFFLIICIVINFIIMLLDFMNIKTAIGLGTIGIVGWHFYYFSGYIIEDLFKENNKKIAIYILGILSFLLVIFINAKVKYYYKFKEPGIFLTFEAFAIYLAIRNIGEIKSAKVKCIISCISNYSYIFYLLHMFIVEKVTKYINVYNNFIYIVGIYIMIFIVTLGLSIIIQNIIIKPIQKLFEELYKFIIFSKKK